MILKSGNSRKRSRALREELERIRSEEKERIQHAVFVANDEIRQLRATVVELRECIDMKEAQFPQKLRDIELQHDREKCRVASNDRETSRWR